MPGALAYCLFNPKWEQGVPKWTTGSRKGSNPSMKNIDDRKNYQPRDIEGTLSTPTTPHHPKNTKLAPKGPKIANRDCLGL